MSWLIGRPTGLMSRWWIGWRSRVDGQTKGPADELAGWMDEPMVDWMAQPRGWPGGWSRGRAGRLDGRLDE